VTRSAIELKKLFGVAFSSFDCAYCVEHDNFISGPHSHVCAKCGQQANRGWYTDPRCERCWQKESAICR